MRRISTFAFAGIAVLFAGFATPAAPQPPPPQTAGAAAAAGGAAPFYLDAMPGNGPTAITNASDSRIVVFADRRIRGVGGTRLGAFVVQPGASLKFTKGRRITGWLILPAGQCVPDPGAKGTGVFAGTPMPVGMKGPTSLCGLMPMAEDDWKKPRPDRPNHDDQIQVIATEGCCDLTGAEEQTCIAADVRVGVVYRCPPDPPTVPERPR